MSQIAAFVGKRVKKARIIAGLTQGELGERLNISLRQMQKVEAGEIEITVDRINEVANVLNIPMLYFFSSSEKNESTPEDILSMPTQTTKNEIICEYTRDKETLKLVFPISITTEDMKEKIEVLVKGIFGLRIQEKKS